jgi:hypothetical protein
VDDLQSAAATMLSEVSGAPAVSARLGNVGGSPGPDNPAAHDFWVVGQIQKALGAGRFDQARGFLTELIDPPVPPVRNQLSALITYHEGASAINARSEQAIPLANLLRPSIKRSLLYIGIVANAQPDIALQIVPLAAADIATLPAEHRVRLQSALAAALVRTDAQSALTTMNLLVTAYNDVYVNPRRIRFDPRAIARRSKDTDSVGDSSLIMAGSRGLYEAVQTRLGRHNFPLRAPSVSAFNMAGFLEAARTIDPARLEAAILGLRDENTCAQSLVALARVRLKAAKSPK